MAYPDDLIEQARTLASTDPRRPKQASLRRAVSAAYYALFHEIAERAVAAILSNADASGVIGDRLRRTVEHKSALRAAKWFGGAGSFPDAVASMRSGSPPVDPSLAHACRVLMDLQAERHLADDDLSAPFSRKETLRRIDDAEAAVRDLRSLPATGDTLIFLLGCVLGEALTRNA